MNSTIIIPAWVDGTLTPVEKIAVHERGLRHLAVSVFVLRDDEVLLQKRALTKYHTPGLWANTCCTHPNWMEDPHDCAQRRLQEELGIAGLDLIHKGQVEYRADVGNGLIEHEVADIFVAKVDGKIGLSPDPSEVMETQWITEAQLRSDLAQYPDRFTPWLRIYMAEHSAQIFG